MDDRQAVLEREYNPRVFVPDHEAIVARGVRRSEAFRRSARRARFDLAYGTRTEERLDLFLPLGSGPFPVHMYIHGGYWRSRDKSEFSYVAEPLVRAGAAVALVNYALCPAVTLDEIVREMRGACAWLWRNASRFDCDPERIHVSGHSAGGHLVAMLLATDWPAFEPGLPRDLVKSGVPISGIFDLAPVMRISVNELVRLDDSAVRRNSPMFLRPATDAPVVVAVGGAESEAFRKQSRELAERWAPFVQRADYLELPGLNHFTILTETANPESPLTRARLELMGLL